MVMDSQPLILIQAAPTSVTVGHMVVVSIRDVTAIQKIRVIKMTPHSKIERAIAGCLPAVS